MQDKAKGYANNVWLTSDPRHEIVFPKIVCIICSKTEKRK